LSKVKDPIRVIHVDDDVVLLQTMKEIIEMLDPEINVALFTSGLDVLKAVDQSIDCIITDYQMPIMDGLELTKKLREQSEIPIIFFTGVGSAELASQAFSIGVNGFVNKREDHEVFMELINEIRRSCHKHDLTKIIKASSEQQSEINNPRIVKSR
jgi:CheY-like chemotaxis protein